MEQERRSIRMGLALIACAVVFRLLGGGVLDTAAAFLSQPDVMSFLLYLETGRVVRPEAPATAPTEEAPPADTVPAAPAKPSPLILPQAADFTMHNGTSLNPDLAALYAQPLVWELTGDAPTVLILHTHATESFTQTRQDTYQATSAYRTLDESRNMVSVGAYVADCLEQGGITVLHDTTLHDYPEYNGSYARSRDTIRQYLAKYPTIRLVLDLHRDASDDAAGQQLGTYAQVDGEEAAQLMLVVGSPAGGLSHAGWQDNLSLAAKLQGVLEQRYPGLCRPVNLRTERFNQDLLPGTLLIEMGAAGDTRQEVLRTGKALADSILCLAHGAVTADSAN